MVTDDFTKVQRCRKNDFTNALSLAIVVGTQIWHVRAKSALSPGPAGGRESGEEAQEMICLIQSQMQIQIQYGESGK